MKLKRLLFQIPEVTVRGSKEVDISGLSADSRCVAPGHLFIAKRGMTYDGRQFIPEAVAGGAVAIVTESYDPFVQATQIIVSSPRRLEACLAARYYGNPSEDLCVIGITGTKGKTTTSYLVRHLLEGVGEKTGLVGTVETIVGERRYPPQLTTHDAITNQKLLREMVSHGCRYAVLEVSSQGLDQGRVDEIAFDIGLFTNLYPDHLDYHHTMETYAAAKRKLFERDLQCAIVNGDSPWAKSMQMGKKTISFGLDTAALCKGHYLRCFTGGMEIFVDAVRFQVPLIGRFNAYNLLGAIAVGRECGIELPKMAEVFAGFQCVPGRLEQIPNPRGIQVFVDYAHTGEALESLLSALRSVVSQKILLVFGCGGGRDPGRRKAMGEAADKWADQSIVTTDNPRGEDPKVIAEQIFSGFRSLAHVHWEPDRKKAIALAIACARPGDCVVIAGKGHEKTQIFAHQTVPFDDVKVAKEALQMQSTSDMLHG